MSNYRKLVGLAALLALAATHARADAAQVNMAGTGFHTQFGVTGGIMFTGTSAVNFSPGLLTMISPLPRAPGGGAVTVFVDGLGVTGTYNCTVSSSVASKSFSKTSGVTWSHSVNFTALELPSTGYLSINCSVPSDGGLKGVTISG